MKGGIDVDKVKIYNSPKEIVNDYFPDRISESCKGGVIGCPYELVYNELIHLTEDECTKFCNQYENSIPPVACEQCWNQKL